MPRINNQTFYENAIKRYGCTAKGLNWNSKQSQHIRFEIIHDLLEAQLSTSKIIDAGCGFGDLYLFLQQKGSLPRKYVGYDMLAEALFVAHKRTKQHFVHKDILNDVTTQQQKAILDLQEKLTIEINNKLNKEPTTFQVSKQDKAIESLQNDIKEVDNKLIALQTSVNSIASLLKKKIDLTIK